KRGAAAAAVKVMAIRGHLEGLGGAVADGTAGSGRALRGGAGCRHQAASASTDLPLIRRLPSLAETLITAPSAMRPSRIMLASGFCSSFWITRLSGRAP